MPDTFDKDAAKSRKNDILQEVQHIRDGINKDVINYYWDTVPQSEEDEKKIRQSMRTYLQQARSQIDILLGGKLY